MTSMMRFLKTPARQSEGRDEGGGSFTDPVFDDEYYGRDKEGGKGRTIGLVVGVVVGAVIAGTAAWFVFGPGGSAERGQTPLIAAEPEPYKVRPENPGGMQVENQDKMVYERVGGETAAPAVENILPPPETPKMPDPPAVEAAAEVAVEAVAEPASVAEPATPVQVPQPVAPPEPAPEPAVQAVEAPMAETPAVAVPAEPAAEPAPAPVAAAPQVQEEPQTLESMVAALSGDYLIQIAALRSEEAAQGEWDRVSRRLPAQLGKYKPLIVRADLGERGIFYRLRAGPIPSRGEAEQLCTSLAAENVGCLVVRNE